MSTNQKTPTIPLPKGWKHHVRSAVLHVISLAQYATIYTRSWAADSTNSRLRVKEVVGEAADSQTQQKLREALDIGLEGEPFTTLESAVTRLARSLFAVAYVKPDHSADATQLDALRNRLYERCRASFESAPLRMDGNHLYRKEAIA